MSAAALLVLAVAAAVLLMYWGVATARLAAFAVQSASPHAVAITGNPTDATLYFRYKGCTRFVTVEVQPAELAEARSLDTSGVFRSPRPYRAAYLRALVVGQARSASVECALGQLRALRYRLGLDSDQYAELIVRFVQSIPYGGVDGRVRLPAEVFADNVAACDDRSLLLSALLVREGYDVALFAFDQQAHAAVGLRSTSSGFRGSGYAFVETNRPAFIGEVGGSYAAWAAWRRDPQIVRIGGKLAYSAEEQSSFVADVLARSRLLTRQLEPYSEYAHTGPARWRAVYAREMERRNEAERTVALIRSLDFDRERLYEVLAERPAGL